MIKIFTWVILTWAAALFVFDVLAWRTTGNWAWAIGAVPLGASWVFCYTWYRRAQPVREEAPQ